jgi:hypothetical protein
MRTDPLDQSGRHRAYDGTEDDFPTYILKVLGRDRTWAEHGACRDHELARKRAWTCRPGDDVEVGGVKLDPKELVKAALMICASCQAQYQCALWAIDIEEEAGTWGMHHDHLLWLIRQDDSEGIVNQARMAGEPVQVAVKQKMLERRRAARLRRLRSEGVTSTS